jgi:hypothetical protein
MTTQAKALYLPLLYVSAFLGFLVWGRPAYADQIVALVDDHGHKIYINVPDMTADTGSRLARHYRPQRSSTALPPEEVDRLVAHTATQKRVDPKLVHSIIQVESGYDPNAVSRKGAMGLMQLIPGTAKRFGVENPFDPKQNIEGGVSYLKYLLDKFGGDVTLSLAAYNAGENSVLRYGGIPALEETQNYVRKVNNLYGSPTPPKDVGQKPKEPPKSVIYRYVDDRGVVHYTNGYEF